MMPKVPLNENPVVKRLQMRTIHCTCLFSCLAVFVSRECRTAASSAVFETESPRVKTSGPAFRRDVFTPSSEPLPSDPTGMLEVKTRAFVSQYTAYVLADCDLAPIKRLFLG